MFALTRRLYDDRVALWATLLFVTNPVVTSFGQAVLSEMPMIALVLARDVRPCAFSRHGPRARLRLVHPHGDRAVCTPNSSPCSSLPVYVLFLLVFVGWRRLFKPDVFWLTVLGVVLCAPIVVMTYVLSPFNVALVRFISTRQDASALAPQPSVLWTIVSGHLTRAR